MKNTKISETVGQWRDAATGWYQAKNAQEQKLLLVLLAFMLVVFPVFGVIIPLANTVNSFEEDYRQQLIYRDTLLSQAATAAAASPGKASFKGSLLSIANSSGKEHGIVFDKLDPKRDSLKASIQRGDFNETITWLNYLSVNFGISVDSISIDRHDDPGFADFRITLVK